MKRLLSIAILMLSSSVMAQTGYVGFSVADTSSHRDHVSSDALIFARLGTDFNDNFSGEIRTGAGFSSGSINSSDEPFEVDFKNLYGAYVRASVSDHPFFPYIIVGYTFIDFDYRDSEDSSLVTGSREGRSWGMGFDVVLTDSIDFNIEYMKYGEEGLDVSGISLGFAAAF